jgi:hypothetical protein
MHGGRSTGARTEAGLARLRKAQTRHGGYSAEFRAHDRRITTMRSRWTVLRDALLHMALLPAELAARFTPVPAELQMPPWSSGEPSRLDDRAAARAEAAALAPWKRAIAEARVARREAALAQACAGIGAANSVATPHAPVPEFTVAASLAKVGAIPHAPVPGPMPPPAPAGLPASPAGFRPQGHRAAEPTPAAPAAPAASSNSPATPHAPVPRTEPSARHRYLTSTTHGIGAQLAPNWRSIARAAINRARGQPAR